MNRPNSAFTVGEQPCHAFKPNKDGNQYATWDNRHECYKCRGLVSWCENCHKDHHADGYETCNRDKEAENG